MKFKSPAASLFIPDQIDEAQALSRCTHLAIGTHPDDIELIGMHGIHQCYESNAKHFLGVVVTNGAGSPRTGEYAEISDDEMIEVRKQEQIEAAKIGRYSAQFQLSYSSQAVKEASADAVEDIKNILIATQPEYLYLHNPLDRHASHRAVLHCCLQALRQLDKAQQPGFIYGVEVWRSLDFLTDDLRVELPRDQYPELSMQLLEVFKSQVLGGKRYDLGFAGRGLANATFAQSHQVDSAQSLSFAVDLKTLVENHKLSMSDFANIALQKVASELA